MLLLTGEYQHVIDGKEGDTYVGAVTSRSATGEPVENIMGYHARTLMHRSEWPDAEALAQRGVSLITELDEPLAAPPPPVPVHADAVVTEQAHRVQTLSHYGYQSQDAFTFRFPLTAQDSASATRSTRGGAAPG